MRDGLRKTLRAATDEVHASAEQQVDLRADIATPAGYRRFLAVMQSTLAAFAAPLDQSSGLSGLEARSASLVAALDKDLTMLDAQPAPTAWAGPVNPIADLYAIGVGYTLEGSSVGAGVLRRQVPDDVPTNYLDALVNERRDRWTHYSRWLDRDALSETTDIGLAINGASDVFRCVLATINDAQFDRATSPA